MVDINMKRKMYEDGEIPVEDKELRNKIRMLEDMKKRVENH
jgi:hypothetical protein